MNRPSLYSVDIWSKWESGILLILTEALSQLYDFVERDYDENDITVELYKIANTIKFRKQSNLFGYIVIQAQNQPLKALGEQENKIRLRKKPDLQWLFIDENASTPEKSQRSFTIECKCLSTSTEEKDYVEKGIKRFVLNEWGYGENERSSIMIGYMKDKDVDRHLCQINKHNEKYVYPLLLLGQSEKREVYRYVQHFKMREFEPKKFSLHHLWTDIRK